jgi:hypothetical protein
VGAHSESVQGETGAFPVPVAPMSRQPTCLLTLLPLTGVHRTHQRRKAPVTSEQVQRTMGAEADAAEDLLETLYKWLSQDGSSSSSNNNR